MLVVDHEDARSSGRSRGGRDGVFAQKALADQIRVGSKRPGLFDRHAWLPVDPAGDVGAQRLFGTFEGPRRILGQQTRCIARESARASALSYCPHCLCATESSVATAITQVAPTTCRLGLSNNPARTDDRSRAFIVLYACPRSLEFHVRQEADITVDSSINN